MRKIKYYSIGQSFGENTKGRETHQIINTSKCRRSLGESLWIAGNQSYAVLKAALLQENGSAENIDANIDESIDYLIDQSNDFLCRDFYPTVIEMLDQEMIELANCDKEKFLDVWPKYELADRFLIFSQLIDGNPLAFKETSDFVPFVCRLAAVSVLSLIDEASLCMLCDDQEGLLECSIDIEKCRTFLTPPTRLFHAIDMAVKMSASEKGKKAAIAKLAIDPKQADKAQVLECWKAWRKTPLDRDGKPKYKGNEAFARDMLKFESLESTQVITRWCRTWEKEHVTQPAQ